MILLSNDLLLSNELLSNDFIIYYDEKIRTLFVFFLLVVHEVLIVLEL